MTPEEFMEQMKKIRSNKFYSSFWSGYKNFDHYFDYTGMNSDQFQLFRNEVTKQLADTPTEFLYMNQNKNIKVFNVPCAFDIETSSFRTPEGRKQACMYIWQFGLAGSVIIGRTWEEFFTFLENLVVYFNLSVRKKLYIYVHNLSYEFQWIKKYFEWEKVFALKKRRVLRAVYEGFEFRCSYLLANASLAHVSEKMLHKYKVAKLVGDLDYSLVHSSKTPLTKKEIDYSVNDVRVVMAFIQESIEGCEGITLIPLTNTGYVREFMRNVCIYTKEDGIKYHAIMKSLRIESPEEYIQDKACLMGGFTHTGILHANRTEYNVDGFDITSSYLAQMFKNYFPMSKAIYIGQPASEVEFKKYLEQYCCIFDIAFFDLLPNLEYENYLSLSRCRNVQAPTINNGRIVSATYLETTLTEVDFELVSEFYDWDSMIVTNLRIYNRGHLPKPIIESVLKFYKAKTELKDVEGEEVEYMRKKNMANSTFGMMLTDIIRPEIILNEDSEWLIDEHDLEEQLRKYNHNFNRFLFYTWGIYVTAHARHELFEMIKEFGDDYLYADTDSVKGLNYKKHIDFVEYRNYINERECRKAARVLDLPEDCFAPYTIKGERKVLGSWEYEGHYERFRAAGAKRYIYTKMVRNKDENGKEYGDPYEKLFMTVAGVNKKEALPYLLEAYPDLDSIFDCFKDGLAIPPEHTGKQTLTYIDEDFSGWTYDYLGNEFYYHEESAIHMEPQRFVMSQTADYLNLIKGIQENELR